MHKTLRASALALGACALAGFSANASAQFSFYNDNGGDGSLSGSYPAFTITGSNNGQGDNATWYVETVATSANISFTWQYASTDLYATDDDPAGYILNDTEVQLSLDAAPGTGSSGTVNLTLTAGDTFGFWVYSLDSLNGAAQLAINEDLAAPPPPPPIPSIPEPQDGVLMLAGLAALFAAVRRRHRD